MSTRDAAAEEALPQLASRRAPRRDAAANRVRLISAASKVFGEHGTDASLELVASEAGLGIATVYRRFPTKESLITEVVDAILLHIVQVARTETASDDGHGLERWLVNYAGIQFRRPGLVAKIWERDPADEPLLEELSTLLGELLSQAQHRGRMRAEAEVSDIVLVLFALRGIVDSIGVDDPRSWRRYLEVTLAGLRTSDTALAEPAWPFGLDLARSHSHLDAEAEGPLGRTENR